MSIDFVSIIETLIGLVAIGILALAAYRALRIGRALVSPIYRSRVHWMAALLVVIIINSLNNYVSYPNTALGWFLSSSGYNLSSLVEFALIFVFVDRVILVAIEMDFFHRNTLHWRKVRKPAYVALFGAAFLPSSSNFPPDSPPAIVIILFFFAAVTALVCSAAALAVGARRTPDKTMRRHVKLVASSFALFLVTTLILGPLSSVPSVNPDYLALVSGLIGVLSTYLIYLAVMSLSPIGRVEKEAGATSKPSQSGVVPPSHP
jgi:hypothetical protein